MEVGTDIEGRSITYDEASRRFEIAGAVTSPERIVAYDRRGFVSWTSDEYKAWVYEYDRTSREFAAQPPPLALPAPAGVPAVSLASGSAPQRSLSSISMGLAIGAAASFGCSLFIGVFVALISFGGETGPDLINQLFPVALNITWGAAGLLAGAGICVGVAALMRQETARTAIAINALVLTPILMFSALPLLR